MTVVEASYDTRRQFSLQELGLLEGPPLRGADTIVKTAADLFGVKKSLFLIFDDQASCLRVRATSSPLPPKQDIPLSDSLSEQVRTENRTLTISDTSVETPFAPELAYLDTAAFAGTPVGGPDGVAIGVLAAIHSTPREWSAVMKQRLESLAYLISQEVMLRASFETLRLMSMERALRS